MKNIRFWIRSWAGGAVIAVCLFMAGPSSAEVSPNLSPVGYWQTISDVTKKPRSVVQIYEENGLLYGRSVKNLDPNEDPNKVCAKCPNEFKDKPVIGLRVIWGLKEKDGEWKGGRVLDPDTGNVYRCKIKVTEGGRQLMIRGFLGISLLGRTQVWSRIENFSQ